MSKILVRNEENKAVEVELEKFLSDFQKEHQVPALDADEENGQPEMDSDTIVSSLYHLAVKGKPLPEVVSSYSEYYDAMKEAVKLSGELEKEIKDSKDAEKQEKEKQKLEAAQKKEAEKQELTRKRNIFLDEAEEGLKDSQENFVNELLGLKESLPIGIKVIVGEDQSFGLEIDKNVSTEDLSRSFGAMLGAQANSNFMANAYQFLVGEIANALVDRGVYDSMIKAGADLSERVAKLGIRLSPRNIESYARMARRIPSNLRNAHVDPTAYLEVSNIPYPPKPKKAEGMSDGDFKLEKAEWDRNCKKIDDDRIKLAEQLKAGQTTVKDGDNEVTVPLLSRKDVLPLVKKLKVAHGLAEEEDKNKMSLSDWLRRYAEIDILLDNFLGVHAKGKVLAFPANDANAHREFTKEELVALKEEAMNNAANMLYGDELATLKLGKKTTKAQVFTEVEGKKVAKKDEGGNLVYTEKEVPVYPRFQTYSV